MNGINFIQPLFHAVVEGRKTMTRRVMKPQPDDNGLHDHTKFPMSDHPSYDREGFWGTVEETGESKQFKPRYKVGETLYLKEPYKIELCEGKYKVFFDYSKNVIDLPQSVSPEGILKVQNSMRKSKSGYCNKLFVVKGLPEYFPYRIEITGVKAEKLQNISDGDCLKEGIQEERPEYYDLPKNSKPNYYHYGKEWHKTTQQAFAALIDKIKRGTWDSNPFVFCYEFKLVK